MSIIPLNFAYAGNVFTASVLNSYSIVDTGQKQFYSERRSISPPSEGSTFFGQDASYASNQPSYTDNSNGTISDNVTGLMWQKKMGAKISSTEAKQKVKTIKLGGYNDWRLPTIKELYSLIQFTGSVKGQHAIAPFIDTKFFSQPLGDTSKGEREIDAQTWSSSEYVGKTMKNDDTIFGVNFVDGRIKGYPKFNPRTKVSNKMYFRYVRENSDYGKNKFSNNHNGTVSDSATGLMWQLSDSLKGMNWKQALNYAEKYTLGGYSDWRLPNAKELQSIVDYTRSPSTTKSAAINPIFITSSIVNEAGKKDYPYYWTSTTHLDGPTPESGAVYIAFGKAMGKMHGNIMDVHGAGSQRSDPKTGETKSRGPQGDMIRVQNYVRLVRGGNVIVNTASVIENANSYLLPNTSVQNKKLRTSRQNISSKKNKFMLREDRNGDGKVSKAEFKGPVHHFRHLDKNSNGYIEANEAPTGPPRSTKPQRN